MKSSLEFKVGISVFFIGLYVALFWLTARLVSLQIFGGAISLLFLPAFVRLMSFLVVGFWSIAILFVAGAICIALGLYDIAPGLLTEAVANTWSSVAAPIGIWGIMAWRRISPDLAGMSPQDLLWLSIGSSASNALCLALVLWFMLQSSPAVMLTFGIFAGDALGTWLTIWMIKAGLTFAGRFS